MRPSSAGIKATVLGCQLAVQKYQFGCVAKDRVTSFWQCSCDYDPLTVSVLDCFEKVLTNGSFFRGPSDPAAMEFNSTILHLESSCYKKLQRSKSLDEYWAIFVNGSHYLTAPSDTNSTLFHPITIDQRISRGYYEGMYWFYRNIETSTWHGRVITLFWVFTLLGLGFLRRIYEYGLSLLLVNRTANKYLNKVIKQYITMPLAVHGHHHTPLVVRSPWSVFSSALVPSRLESVVLTVYVVLMFYLLIFGYQLKENMLFPSTVAQAVRYVADRSGVIAIDHVPVLIALAGRNNLITSLSLESYDNLIVYHKWVSRGMFFNAFIHSAAYIIIELARGSLVRSLQEAFFIFGVLATVCGAVLLLQAMHFLRSRWYEAFLVIHIVFASGFLAGMVVHCLTVGWTGYIVASIALWIFDRISRAVKMYKYGAPMASLSVVGDTILKLEAPKRCLNVFPGCHVFAYLWVKSTMLQSHPFCVIESVTNPDNVVIYIQAKKGATQKVFEHVKRAGGACRMKVTLEGPYGVPHSLEKYQKVVFIAGGTGVPGVYYAMKQLAATSEKTMKFYWSTRKLEDMKWFRNELETLGAYRPELYLSQEKPFLGEYQEQEDGEEEEEENQLSENMPLKTTRTMSDRKFYQKFCDKAQIHFQSRPNVTKIVEEECECENQWDDRRSVAFVYCGPPSMCDEIRGAVVAVVGKHAYVIDIFEELQTW